MPRVPAADSAQVAPGGMPGVQQSSVVTPGLLAAPHEAFGRNAQAVMKGGQELTANALAMQERENADKIFQAETEIKDAYLKFEAQARERRGEAAKGLTVDTDKWWLESRDKYRETLENDAQRRIFDQSVAKLSLASRSSMSEYEGVQRRESLRASATASINTSINFAAANANDPQAINIARNDITKRAAALSALDGKGEEWGKEFAAEKLTQLHTNVIQNLVDVNPAAAREYYTKFKSEINGTAHDQVDKMLKTGGIKSTSQKFADSVIAEGIDEPTALKRARETFDGEEETAVVQEIKTRFAERAQIRERDQRTAADTAWGIFARAGRINAIPTNVLDAMDGKDLAALKKHALEVAGVEKLPKTDWNRYYELRQMATSDPQAFQKLDLRREFGSLGKSEREGLIDLQAKVKDPKEVKNAATLDAQLSNMHDQLGWGSSDKEKKGVFDRVVMDAIDAEQRARGKELNYQERQQLIDRMIVEGKVVGSRPRFLPDRGGRFYEFANTPDAEKFEPKINDTDRATITSRFEKRHGRKPTDAEITDTYRLWKGLP